MRTERTKWAEAIKGARIWWVTSIALHEYAAQDSVNWSDVQPIIASRFSEIKFCVWNETLCRGKIQLNEFEAKIYTRLGCLQELKGEGPWVGTS